MGCSRSAHEAEPLDPEAEAQAAAESLERAVAVTTRMLEKYRVAKSYADHAAYVEESVERGVGVAHEYPYYEIVLAFERPNRLRLSLTESVANAAGGRGGFTIACDGEFVRAAVRDIPDQIIEKPAPAQITAANALVDPLIAHRLKVEGLGDIVPQLAMLLNDSDEDEAAIFPHDAHPRMLEDAELAGRTCHRVATSHPDGTRVLWIDAETFILRRMELPSEAARAEADPDRVRYLRLTVRIDFRDPTFDAEIEPQTFAIEAPPGAHRVRRFVMPEEGLTAKDAKEEEAAGEEEQDE
jgi:outer membrane lipoprotein-sorting protein